MNFKHRSKIQSTRRFTKTVVVPTALSLLLQTQMSAAFAGHSHDFNPATMGLSFGSQSRHELRQLRRIDNVQARMQAATVQSVRIPRFDLNSVKDVVSLTQNDLGGSNSVQLMLGGISQSFAVGDRVSAAEYVAIKGGALTLDSKGRAEGGQFSLNALGQTLSDANIGKIFIPQNVTALSNFSNDANLKLSGDVVNRGTIYGFSTNAANQTGNLFTDSFYNRHGGSISSVTPSSLTQSYGTAVSDFSLSLNATKDIVNSGNITSGGALSLNAGGSITNALSAGESGSSPTIQAAQALNLVAGSGQINNAGTISSLHNDLNLSAQSVKTAMVINGTGGVFDAQNGNINIRTGADVNAGDVSLTGGDYLSNNLNIYANSGNVFGDVGKVTGTINTQATTQHFYASTDTLTLGNNCITGDPTFVNTSGSIVINGVCNFNESLAIIASGDITATNGAQINNPGGNVIMIAGAKATTSGATTTGVSGTKATSNVVVSLDPTQSPGGNIDLSAGSAATVINTSSSGKAGDVTLVALSGIGGNGGTVRVMGIDAHCSNTSANIKNTGGNVTIIAGANPAAKANTINTNFIYTGGGAASTGGAITLLTQQPVSNGPNNTLTITSAGIISQGNLHGSGKTLARAGISAGGDLVTAGMGGYDTGGFLGDDGANAGTVTITAGGSINTNNILAFGAGGMGNGGTSKPNSSAGGNGGNINITSLNGNITIFQANTSGGGGGGTTIGKYEKVGGAGGTAGNINISAAGTVLLADAVYAVNGGDGGKLGAGGGGGSYGGGGGGEAIFSSGGGGGGYFGGGGGGAFPGGGGGGLAGGQGGEGVGGVGAGQNGSLNTGGNGSASNKGGAGGTLGKGGAPGTPSKGTSTAGQDANTSTASVTITAGDALTAEGPILGGVVKLATTSTTAGDITLKSAATGFKSIEFDTQTGLVLTKAINSGLLTFKSTNGSFGAAAQRIQANITSLNVDTGDGVESPSVFIDNNQGQGLTITGVSVKGGIFDLTSTGPVTTNGAVNASIIRLTSAGDITVNAALGKTTTSEVNLTTSGSANIFATNLGKITGTTVKLASTGGSIVGTKGSALALDTSNLTVNTGGTGMVDLINSSGGGMTLANSSAGKSFELINQKGNLTVNNIVTNAGANTKNGSITLTNQVADISVNANAQITANGGNILITATTTSGKITVGSNAKISASSSVAGVGNVTLNTGAVPVPVPGTLPDNAVVNQTNGGKVYFGPYGNTFLKPNNTLNANARNIIFSGDKKTSITLNGGVIIGADRAAN